LVLWHAVFLDHTIAGKGLGNMMRWLRAIGKVVQIAVGSVIVLGGIAGALSLVLDPQHKPGWQGLQLGLGLLLGLISGAWNSLTALLDEQAKVWHLVLLGFVIVLAIERAAERIATVQTKRRVEY
jgi:hypothetical protein